MPETLVEIARRLSEDLHDLEIGDPVAYVYRPLEYAAANHEAYLRRYGASSKEVVLVGMNPGPWGMAQTGVPFGEVTAVRDWLGLDEPVGRPPVEHPKSGKELVKKNRRIRPAQVAELEQAGKIQIRGAMYDVATGRVSFLDS